MPISAMVGTEPMPHDILVPSNGSGSPLRRVYVYLGVFGIQAPWFRTRLVVERQVEPGIEHALVPILVTQPLIENGCRHGISRRPAGGRVVPRAERLSSEAGGGPSHGPHHILRLSVINDGPERQAPPEDRDEASRGGGVEAVIEIPFHWSPVGPARRFSSPQAASA